MTEDDDDDAAPRQLPAGIGYVWQRVAADLRDRIAGGAWPYGGRLPNRDELAAEYGVADRTVRRALRELESEGLVTVMPAKGAYVTWSVHN